MVQAIVSNFPVKLISSCFCISINEVWDILVLVLDRLINFPVFSQSPFNEFLTCFVINDELIVN